MWFRKGSFCGPLVFAMFARLHFAVALWAFGVVRGLTMGWRRMTRLPGEVCELVGCTSRVIFANHTSDLSHRRSSQEFAGVGLVANF